MKGLAGLIVILMATGAFAKPILNQTEAFSKPIFLTVFADSEDKNQFYFVPNMYAYCGWKDGKPDFSFKKFEDNTMPFVVVRFTLCADGLSDQRKAVIAAQDELRLKNPSAKLSPIPAMRTEIANLPDKLPWMPVDFKCDVIAASGDRQDISCLILASGKRSVRDIESVFKGFDGLTANGYFYRMVDGVEYNEKTKRFSQSVKNFPIVYTVPGMKSYPHTWLQK